MSEKIISELYCTIQGEGIFSGRPSLLVRFQNCNLKCSWCDTQNIQPPMFSIKDYLSKLRDNPYHDIIITGGEPLLYEKAVKEIIRETRLHLGRKHKNITIETNCTIYPERELINLMKWEAKGFWSISPKLPSSGQTYDQDILQKFMKEWLNRRAKCQVKFVVGSKRDFKAMTEILDGDIYQGIPVIIQPVANPTTLLKYSEEYRLLVDEVLKLSTNHDIRVLPQMHKIVWGLHSGGV